MPLSEQGFGIGIYEVPIAISRGKHAPQRPPTRQITAVLNLDQWITNQPQYSGRARTSL